MFLCPCGRDFSSEMGLRVHLGKQHSHWLLDKVIEKACEKQPPRTSVGKTDNDRQPVVDRRRNEH